MQKKIIKMIAVLGLCLCLHGCIAAAAATAYGVSRHRTHHSYNEYVANMDKVNQDRQKQGLEPLPVATFDDWKKNRKELSNSAETQANAPSTGK